MAINRSIVRIETPPNQRGFLGADHTARPVVYGDYKNSDPFILLMDDFLDKKDNEPVGGAHPHAGFETVSLLLEGEIGDDAHKMSAGDFQLMTAGSGIVHTETIDKAASMRLLQLWVNLPRAQRAATPRVQDLPLQHVPTLAKDGVQIKLYSGSLAGLTSPIQNYVPMTIVDITIAPGVTTTLDLPADYNTFLYVLEGSAATGEDKQQLNKDQVGWLNLTKEPATSALKLTAGAGGIRCVLYAGKPQGEEFLSHGPFIADSAEDINRLYREYRQGKMQHISEVADNQRILW